MQPGNVQPLRCNSRHRAFSLARACLWLSLVLPLQLFAYSEALPRYALIIGNSSYDFAPLKNPANDARDIADQLTRLGYKTTLALDVGPEQFRQTVQDFYQSIREENAVSVFYYAGHGVQLQSINYLIPVNSPIESPAQLASNGYPVTELLAALHDSVSHQNIVILDACRNNPFKRSKRNDSQVVELQLEQGLAPVEAPPGTLIAYATEPGNVAEDGRGRNGTYTKALLRHIGKAETAEELFKKVRKDVLQATRNRQTPWEHSSLLETFYFAPPKNDKIPNLVNF